MDAIRDFSFGCRRLGKKHRTGGEVGLGNCTREFHRPRDGRWGTNPEKGWEGWDGEGDPARLCGDKREKRWERIPRTGRDGREPETWKGI